MGGQAGKQRLLSVIAALYHEFFRFRPAAGVRDAAVLAAGVAGQPGGDAVPPAEGEARADGHLAQERRPRQGEGRRQPARHGRRPPHRREDALGRRGQLQLRRRERRRQEGQPARAARSLW